MFVIPIRHDRLIVQRWPVVTGALIAACVAGWLLQLLVAAPVMPGQVAAVDRWLAHIPADAEEAIAQGGAISARFAWYLRYGVTRAAPTLHGWWTYGFVHGGLMHLLGNTWFLWLTAPLAEDRWGRGRFLAFYLLILPLAALPHVVGPSPYTPLVGASGAVAACMAAFVALHGRARMQFFYLLPPIVLLWRMRMWGTFVAPAWLMIGMWFLLEVLSSGAPDGVAHDVHVAGFVLGLLGTLVLEVLQPPAPRRTTARAPRR